MVVLRGLIGNKNLTALKDLDENLHRVVSNFLRLELSYKKKVRLVNNFLRKWDEGNLRKLVRFIKQIHSIEELDKKTVSDYERSIGRAIRCLSTKRVSKSDIFTERGLEQLRATLSPLKVNIKKQLHFFAQTEGKLILERQQAPVLTELIEEEKRILGIQGVEIGVLNKSLVGKERTNIVRRLAQKLCRLLLRRSKPKIALFIECLPENESYLSWVNKDPKPFTSFERIVKRVYSRDQFLESIKEVGETKKISFLLIAIHGSPYAIFFPDDSTLTVSDIRKGVFDGYDKYFHRDGGNNSYFHACSVAGAEHGSFAELFFEKLRINGEASTHTTGLVPILNSQLKVPADLKYPCRVEVSGPDAQGIAHHEVIFEDITFTLQSNKGVISGIDTESLIYNYPEETPEPIIERFANALRNHKFKRTDIVRSFHYEKRTIHPWIYFKNV